MYYFFFLMPIIINTQLLDRKLFIHLVLESLQRPRCSTLITVLNTDVAQNEATEGAWLCISVNYQCAHSPAQLTHCQNTHLAPDIIFFIIFFFLQKPSSTIWPRIRMSVLLDQVLDRVVCFMIRNGVIACLII